MQHLCQVGLRRECSLVATAFEGQWSALPTSAHSRGHGSLTGQGSDSVVAEPDKLSMDKSECWVWDQVYTLDAIPVLSLATCMVIDVVFPVNEKRSHQNCWAGAMIANLLAALGVARLRVASQCAHPPRWACRVIRMLPPKWLQGISDPSCPLVFRIREVCSVRFPANGFGASIVYVLAGHSGVYVGKGKRKRPSSWLRRSRSPFASIWSHQSVLKLCTPVSGPSWESRFPGPLGLALPFKHLYTLQIRETFAKEAVLGPINLFDWKRVGLLIVYLCCVRPFLCTWFRDSLARFWIFWP